jgi:hypothetical protein
VRCYSARETTDGVVVKYSRIPNKRLETNSQMTTLPKLSLRHFAIIAFLIVCVAGVQTADANLIVYLQEIIKFGKPTVPASDGDLLEGLFQDAIGVAFTFAFHGPVSTQLAWVLGMFCAAGALAFSIWDKSIDATVALLAVAFTRIVDTCCLWVGKLDPFLFTFLILTINRRRWLAVVAAGLAAFCHPIAAVVSTIGVNAITYWTERRVNWAQLATVVVCAVVDILIVRHIFPSITTRTGLFLLQFKQLMMNGIELGISGATIGIVLPIVAAICLGRLSLSRPDWHGAPALLWLAGAFAIASVLTLDHTRDATLIFFVPYMAWLNHQLRSQSPAGIELRLFSTLFLFRLFVPHVALEGAKIFEYEQLTRLVAGHLH